jgi:hypothetical protein
MVAIDRSSLNTLQHFIFVGEDGKMTWTLLWLHTILDMNGHLDAHLLGVGGYAINSLSLLMGQMGT